MNKSTQISIARNFPEFVREEYPLFVKLVEEYYRYLDTTNIGNIDSVTDIDSTPDQFIEYFRRQYAINISSFWNLDFKEFLYFAKSFYSSRGSETSIRFLFRAMFGEEIEIDYPGQYVLRASDGKWSQEFHIELKTLYGNFPEEGKLLHFENSSGIYTILPRRIEVISGTDRCFVFFEQPYRIFVDLNQKLIQKNDSDETVYAGQLAPSSSRVVIENGGKYWQVGAVIRIPGTIKDTFARVTKVDSEGSIQYIEVLEYGYDHEENQALILSPFPNRPIGSIVDIDSTIINASPLAYHHTINIQDFTDGCIESVHGTSSDQDYFIDLFFESYPGFFGKTVINRTQNIPAIAMGEGETISIEQWLESRATLTFSKDNVVRDRGFYSNSDSLLSNKEIRLQDNFFYQAFSYVVETEQELKSYRDSIGLTHPAGMKFFSLMNREVLVALTPEITKIIGTEQINKNEILYALEHAIRLFTKELVDSVVVDHTIPQLELIKPFVDNSISSDKINSKLMTKLLTEEILTPEELTFEFDKELVDQVEISDNDQIVFSKNKYDIVDIQDILNKISNKPIQDSIIVETGNSFSIVDDSFFSSDYYQDLYFNPQRKLEIQ